MGALTSHTAALYVEEAKKQGVDLKAVHCIVTGASSGMGLEAARVLAVGGAHVVMACRNVAKGEKCIADMKGPTGDNEFKKNLLVLELNLESFDSVKQFAVNYLALNIPLNLLICNAGFFPAGHEVTKDGYEKCFQTCHLGHWLLFRLLQAKLESSAPSRVVMVASLAHMAAPKWDWPGEGNVGFGVKSHLHSFRAYGQAKLANILMARYISKELGSKGVRAFSLHPGGVNTPIYPWWLKPFTKVALFTPEQGAAPAVMLALSKEVVENNPPTSAPYYAAGFFSVLPPARSVVVSMRSGEADMRRLAEESDKIARPFL